MVRNLHRPGRPFLCANTSSWTVFLERRVNAYFFVLGALVVWRVTHLLNAEDGPWDAVVRLRRAVGNGFLGALMDCFYCLSLWVSAPVALAVGQSWLERALLWPALSAAAILLERVTQRQESLPFADHESLDQPSPPMLEGNSRAPQEDHDAVLR